MVKFVDEQSENDRLKTENIELLEALRVIASYGKGGPHQDGVCPYGCDCPYIAEKAIAKATNQEAGR